MSNKKRFFFGLILLVIFTFALAGCGGATYSLKCNIDTESFDFSIEGEKGASETSFNNESQSYTYDPTGQMSAITVTVNRDVTFEESKHKYHIEGTITLDIKTDGLTYDITGTGDAFGNTPQTCKKP